MCTGMRVISEVRMARVNAWGYEWSPLICCFGSATSSRVT
jgi:hypothetical protein